METRTISNRHIIWIAAGFVLLMFIAFTPTYFSPMVKGTFDGLPIFHLHGALFFAWPVLFLLQAILAEQGRLNLHRSLGLVGIVLATSMFFTGIAAVARDLRVNEYGLALIAFAGLIMFSLFVILALVYRKRREYHLRMAKAREAHPAILVGGAALILMHSFRHLALETSAWRASADLILALTR